MKGSDSISNITILTIAEQAGVSKSTVDRALKNDPKVKPETREKILRIASDLGYTPNMAGRALRRQREPLTIAVAFCWKTFDLQMKEGILAAQEELSALGLRLRFFDMQTGDEEEQHSLLGSLASEKIDALIIKPSDTPDITEQINRIEASGVPVLTLSTDLPSSKRSCFIGQDYYQSGRAAGSLMGKNLHGPGRIILFQESNAYHVYRARARGFLDCLSERYPAFHPEPVVLNRETSPENYDQAVAFFKDNRDIRGVLCTGNSYLHIARALTACGIHPECLIGYDVFRESAPLMEHGVVDYLITQNPWQQGYQAVKVLFNYLMSDRQEKLPETIYMPLHIINYECLQTEAPENLSKI